MIINDSELSEGKSQAAVELGSLQKICPSTWECDLIWKKKGLCRCNQVKDPEMRSPQDYAGGP